MILESIPAIQSLSTDEKLRLVYELWEDVSRSSDTSPRIAELLDQRLAEYATDPAAVHTTEEVTAGIAKLKEHLRTTRS